MEIEARKTMDFYDVTIKHNEVAIGLGLQNNDEMDELAEELLNFLKEIETENIKTHIMDLFHLEERNE